MQAGKTRERQVGELLDIVSHRSDKHFKLFLYALVDVDQDEFALELDKDIATEFIRQRNVNRGDTQGMIFRGYHAAVFISSCISSPSDNCPRAVNDRGLDIGADMTAAVL